MHIIAISKRDTLGQVITGSFTIAKCPSAHNVVIVSSIKSVAQPIVFLDLLEHVEIRSVSVVTENTDCLILEKTLKSNPSSIREQRRLRVCMGYRVRRLYN